ncbi:MAG: hypothetical protein HW385_929, partial [candidate division NC10 bacterium]|nr:hypothetical protein [candidate division NC10 bacterium]
KQGWRLNWRSRSSDRPSRSEHEAAFSPSRRFLMLASARPGRLGRVRRLAALIGPRMRKVAMLVMLLAVLVTLGQVGRREVPRLLGLRYFKITDLVVEGNRRVPTASVIQSLDLPPRASSERSGRAYHAQPLDQSGQCEPPSSLKLVHSGVGADASSGCADRSRFSRERRRDDLEGRGC